MIIAYIFLVVFVLELFLFNQFEVRGFFNNILSIHELILCLHRISYFRISMMFLAVGFYEIGKVLINPRVAIQIYRMRY